MEIEWTATALDDMAAFDKGIGRRVKSPVERFAETGAGSVKQLHGFDPPEFRLRAGDYRAPEAMQAQTFAKSLRIVLQGSQ